MSPVAVSADRRFHRAHVKPARRRAAWRGVAISTAKYGALVLVLAIGVAKAAVFATTSPLLRISHIDPAGNHRVSSEALRGMLTDLRGENILFVDLEPWRETLLGSPWVRDVSFRRSLPSTVEVFVQERTPIAIGRVGGRLYLVDERGATIDEYGPQYASLDLPIVDGFSAREADRDKNEARGALAARLILSLKPKPAVAQRLSQVDVSDPHNVSIYLNDDSAELKVGDDHFLARVESYLSLASALRQRVPEIDYVDLRFDGRVYVRPTGTPGKPGASGAGRPAVSRVNDAARR
jgi:cell division protein FtsQ